MILIMTGPSTTTKFVVNKTTPNPHIDIDATLLHEYVGAIKTRGRQKANPQGIFGVGLFMFPNILQGIPKRRRNRLTLMQVATPLK